MTEVRAPGIAATTVGVPGLTCVRVNPSRRRPGRSDLVVVASPTYKATYTGILKSFFDRYNSDALVGTVSIPVMTGAAPIHALAPEVHLRPLLVELGSSTPTRGCS